MAANEQADGQDGQQKQQQQSASSDPGGLTDPLAKLAAHETATWGRPLAGHRPKYDPQKWPKFGNK